MGGRYPLQGVLSCGANSVSGRHRLYADHAGIGASRQTGRRNKPWARVRCHDSKIPRDRPLAWADRGVAGIRQGLSATLAGQLATSSCRHGCEGNEGSLCPRAMHSPQRAPTRANGGLAAGCRRWSPGRRPGGARCSCVRSHPVRACGRPVMRPTDRRVQGHPLTLPCMGCGNPSRRRHARGWGATPPRHPQGFPARATTSQERAIPGSGGTGTGQTSCGWSRSARTPGSIRPMRRARLTG